VQSGEGQRTSEAEHTASILRVEDYGQAKNQYDVGGKVNVRYLSRFRNIVLSPAQHSNGLITCR
jgi:hypothetical protein